MCTHVRKLTVRADHLQDADDVERSIEVVLEQPPQTTATCLIQVCKDTCSLVPRQDSFMACAHDRHDVPGGEHAAGRHEKLQVLCGSSGFDCEKGPRTKIVGQASKTLSKSLVPVLQTNFVFAGGGSHCTAEKNGAPSHSCVTLPSGRNTTLFTLSFKTEGKSRKDTPFRQPIKFSLFGH